MVQRSRGFRGKTRGKLRKRPRERGKVTITRMLRTFNVGERVTVLQEPAIHDGMPHPRYMNKTGMITRKQGNAYVVKIRDGNSYKDLISSAVHLRKA